jgi:hypothetical protein
MEMEMDIDGAVRFGSIFHPTRTALKLGGSFDTVPFSSSHEWSMYCFGAK